MLALDSQKRLLSPRSGWEIAVIVRERVVVIAWFSQAWHCLRQSLRIVICNSGLRHLTKQKGFCLCDTVIWHNSAFSSVFSGVLTMQKLGLRLCQAHEHAGMGCLDGILTLGNFHLTMRKSPGSWSLTHQRWGFQTQHVGLCIYYYYHYHHYVQMYVILV